MKLRSHFSFFLLLVAMFGPAFGGSVRETIRVVSWPTREASPPPRLEATQAAWLPMLRLALDNMGESQIIEAALANPQVLGLNAEDATKLRQAASEIYAEIAADPVWRKCPSLLAYCYAEQQPVEGRALVVMPEKGPRPNSPVVIFLHGDGGLFTWYAYRLYQIFPEAVLVFPAYGVNPSHASPAYLEDALHAAWSGVDHPPPAPFIVGLSSGGFAVQRMWVRRPAAYAGVLVLGAYAPGDVAGAAPRDARIAPYFLIGAEEPFIREPAAIREMSLLRRRTPRTVVRQIPEADHFFLLTHREASAGFMRAWLYAKPSPPAK